MADEVDALLQTRDGYDDELIWHKFLLDAYAGTGGFMGRIRMPFASFWGAAADIYARSNVPVLPGLTKEEAKIDTYLDRFLREDIPKFQRRAFTSQYPNYVEPIIDIRLSFLNRKEIARKGVEPLTDWMQNADGVGRPWDRILREVIEIRAAILGWTPVLFDKPRLDLKEGEQISRAQAAEKELGTRAIPLFPANLLDWDLDEHGQFVWAKIAVTRERKTDPFSKPVQITTVTVWTRKTVQQFVVAKDGDGKMGIIAQDDKPVPHELGRVPLLIARHKPIPNEPVKGQPMGGSISLLARKLFNYLSELDEHIRSSVFAFLQVPAKSQEQLSTLVLGSSNALAVPPDSSQGYKWISPDASVATTIENRVEKTTEEIFRVGRSEFARAKSGGQAESGLSRAFQFENTNRAIADFALNLAHFDQEALGLVAKMEGIKNSDVRSTAPTKFDVEEMQREIDEAIAARSLDLPPTADVELIRRLVRKILPNIDAEAAEAIEQELDERLMMAQQQARADAELAAGGTKDPDDDPDTTAHVHDLPGGSQTGSAGAGSHSHSIGGGGRTSMAEAGPGHTHTLPDSTEETGPPIEPGGGSDE